MDSHIGGGGIQLTHDYNYYAFATYMILKDYPKLQEENSKLEHLPSKSNGLSEIQKMYNKVVNLANKRL